MKMRRITFAGAAAAVVVAAGVVAGGAAGATPSNDYACYSATGAAGVWSSAQTNVFASWSTFAPGYFTPFAEKTVVTTVPMNSYYLTCSMPTGWKVTGYVTDGGEALVSTTSYIINGQPIPGIYPVIAPGP